MPAPQEIAPDVAYIRTNVSNVYLVGTRENWVLMDAGVVGYTSAILQAAEARFGAGHKPQAIVVTHGHYDHVGCALELARYWSVPVFAHRLEFPYLQGNSAYPRKDPTVGGAMAFLSRFFPSRTANISEVLQELPRTGEVPGAEGWVAIPTPGHAPGHVSFWRESDRTLIAGDVCATANLDSWSGMVSQRQEIARPPSPFTYDWEQARASVNRIAELRPKVLACGHGEPMTRDTVAQELEQFANSFTPPKQGCYVSDPARANEHGVFYEPPKPPDHLPKIAAGVVTGIFVLAGVVYRKRTKKTEL